MLHSETSSTRRRRWKATAARKREFFQRLKDNLANDDREQQARLVDEFRALILGR